jgi:threonine dehydrogenase-like Zn-dependent dehydrogenase
MPRTLVLDGPRRLRLADQPNRPLRPGEIRLRARLSAISHGTELGLYRGTSAFTDKVFDRGLRAFVHPQAGSAATYPVTLGYEMVGEVTEVAPDVHEVEVGDLVHTGTPHQEETVLDVAASLEATYPLVRLPTAERPERALFISLAAVALQAVHDAEMKLGDAVSVHGLGTIGPQIRQLNGDVGVGVAIEVSRPGRGVPPQPAVADRLHRRLGRPPPARPPVEPAPGDGHRHPAALHRPGLDRRPACPPNRRSVHRDALTGSWVLG